MQSKPHITLKWSFPGWLRIALGMGGSDRRHKGCVIFCPFYKKEKKQFPGLSLNSCTIYLLSKSQSSEPIAGGEQEKQLTDLPLW